MSVLDTEKFCLTLKEKLDRMDEKMFYTREIRGTFQPFIVQDPFDGRNATYSVFTKRALKVIKDKFKKTAEAASSHTTLVSLCQLRQQEKEMNEISDLNLEDIVTISGLNLQDSEQEDSDYSDYF